MKSMIAIFTIFACSLQAAKPQVWSECAAKSSERTITAVMYQEEGRSQKWNVELGNSRRRFVTYHSVATQPYVVFVFGQWRDFYFPIPYTQTENIAGMSSATHVASQRVRDQFTAYARAGLKGRERRLATIKRAQSNQMERTLFNVQIQDEILWQMIENRSGTDAKMKDKFEGQDKDFTKQHCEILVDDLRLVEQAYALIQDAQFPSSGDCTVSLLPGYAANIHCQANELVPPDHMNNYGNSDDPMLSLLLFFRTADYPPPSATLKLVWQPMHESHYQLTVLGYVSRELYAARKFEMKFFFFYDGGRLTRVNDEPKIINTPAPDRFFGVEVTHVTLMGLSAVFVIIAVILAKVFALSSYP